MKISRKTEGNPRILGPQFFHPYVAIAVAHANYFHANYSSPVIGLFRLALER